MKIAFTNFTEELTCDCCRGKWRSVVYMVLPDLQQRPIAKAITDSEPSKDWLEKFVGAAAEKALKSAGMSIDDAKKIERFYDQDAAKAAQRYFNEHDRGLN